MTNSSCDSCHGIFRTETEGVEGFLCEQCKPPFELTEREKALFDWILRRQARVAEQEERFRKDWS
jgi:hypothetical protein